MPPHIESALHDPPLPPPPSLLVGKLSAVGSSKAPDASKDASISEILASASLTTQLGELSGSISKHSQPEVTSTLAAQTLVQTAELTTPQLSAKLLEQPKTDSASGVDSSAENGSTGTNLPVSADLSQVLTLQHQLLAQLASSQQDMMKQVRAEVAKAAMASEATMKAYLKRADQERAKEIKRDKEDLEKQLQVLVNTVTKDLSVKVTTHCFGHRMAAPCDSIWMCEYRGHES
jgi:hypothetical protein